jgi:hypothetical protein
MPTNLIPATPLFSNNSPPWYNCGKWGALGCAIPMPGKYLQTENESIWDLVNLAGLEAFDANWSYDDRLLNGPLSKECAIAIYNLIIQGRKMLGDITVQPQTLGPISQNTSPTYKTFVVYPIPLYGKLGIVNPYIQYFNAQVLRFMSECMKHQDNGKSLYVTPTFQSAVQVPLQLMLVKLATSHFGYAGPAVLGNPAFTLAQSDWDNYNPYQFITPAQRTGTPPPPGYKPNSDEDSPIRGLPIDAVLPLCQPWPDQQLFFSPGGVWAGQSGGPPAAPGSSTVDPTTSPDVPTTEEAAAGLAASMGTKTPAATTAKTTKTPAATPATAAAAAPASSSGSFASSGVQPIGSGPANAPAATPPATPVASS